MIHRKVAIEGSNQYSLYHPGRQIWLDENKTLQDYEMEPNVSLLVSFYSILFHNSFSLASFRE